MMPESRTVVQRPTWRDDHLKCLCGFANAQGGVLEIGKDDRGEIVGIDEVLSLLDDIPRKARALLGIAVDVSLKSASGQEYIEVAVEPHANPISYRGEYHYRNGGTERVLDSAAVNRLLLQRHGRTWDDAPQPGVGIKDLDDRPADLFRQRAADSGRLPPDIIDESIDGLIEELDLRDGPYLKRAAVLLFHPSPHRVFAEASVRISCFRGSEELFRDVVEGNVFTQIDETIDLLYTKYTRGLISYDGIYRVETFPVPSRAMREAVVNAIVHRDYGRPAPVQIHVRNDRISIWNAAVLHSEWTAFKVADECSSKPRNPKVAHALFRAGMIEAWGRGVRQIVNACLDADIPPPTWKPDADGHGLRVTFPFSADYKAADAAVRGVAIPVAATPKTTPTAAGNGEEQPEKRHRTADSTRRQPDSPETHQKTARTSPESPDLGHSLADRIVAHLRAHPSASRRQVAVALDVTEKSVRYQLDKLKASGLVRRVWVVAAGSPENHQKTARNHPDQPENVALPDRILALLSQNPAAGRREIAATLGTTESAVRYRLDKLRAEGRIERVGPDKGGVWKVLDRP